MTFFSSRRSVLAGMAFLGLNAGRAFAQASGASLEKAHTPSLAITIDDFDLSDTPLMTGEERDTAMRLALERHDVQAAGFVAGKFVDADRAPRVLAQWSNDGHILGNHTFAHGYFGGQDPDAYMADVLKCEPLIRDYAGFRKLFRFPYLAEGRTAEGRDAMRALLKEHGYRNAHVTIDTSDWYIDNRLKARLKDEPDTPLDRYRSFYLDHIWERATYYDGLAKALLGHSIDHTILLHHRLTTGLFLDDLLTMFTRRGWRLANAEATLASPLYATEPAALPAGQSLVWAMAKTDARFEDQLRYPGEDGEYEAPRMDALGL